MDIIKFMYVNKKKEEKKGYKCACKKKGKCWLIECGDEPLFYAVCFKCALAFLKTKDLVEKKRTVIDFKCMNKLSIGEIRERRKNMKTAKEKEEEACERVLGEFEIVN
jgi:hypothetical protein